MKKRHTKYQEYIPNLFGTKISRYSQREKDSNFLKKLCKKVLTKKRVRDIMYKLTRESTAPNLENDTETT
ncbi:MAG: hypothetical protein ACI4MJ_07015, partial [Aristaeellaceae bacterium]